ncbi:MAG TPA: hypothetical protein VII73_04545 [Caulobacteraceae bacterium]
MQDVGVDTAPSAPRDSLSALLCLGVLAYVGETLLHEAVGHGGMCLATGGRVTALAPLWMRCSVVTPVMILCGPAINFFAGGLLFAVLRYAPPSGAAAREFLWLSFAFNLLVAFGYLVVGGASGFGDWGVLLAGVRPAILWRLPAVLVGAAGYYAALIVAARLYGRLNGAGAFAQGRLLGRTLVASAGAAIVACAAEIAGGRLAAGPLVLALGCTLAVGASLTRIGGFTRARNPGQATLTPIRASPWLLAAGVAVALVFIFVVGPGFDASSAAAGVTPTGVAWPHRR